MTYSSFCTRIISTLLFLAVISAALSSCSSKAVIKPHSEVVSEAASKGIVMPTVEESRTLFYKPEEEDRARLLELVEARIADSSQAEIYRIGAGDKIEVNVFDVPELNVAVNVRESGFLSLPLIGAVKAQGLTDMELQESITEKLSAYVKRPQVSVYVSDFGSQKVAVIGAVRNPGAYPLKKGVNNLLELIGEAGGLTEHSGNVMNFVPVELSKKGGSEGSRARLSLVAAGKNPADNSGIEIYLDEIMGTSGGIPIEVPVRGGDMVIVPEAGKIMVEGEVEKSGSYELGRRMSLLSALAAAGGITYAAKIDEVEVIRSVGADERARLIVSLEKISSGEASDVKLKTGDIVRVPSHSGRRLRQDTFEGITKLINFGVGGSVNLAQ
ncbi:MAG: polysaccharide export protein [Deltaproteobacteria bacterium]|nr:polysaccharide export protein [Deltaproteobacteria bacterium]